MRAWSQTAKTSTPLPARTAATNPPVAATSPGRPDGKQTARGGQPGAWRVVRRFEPGGQDVALIQAIPRWYHQTAFRSSLEADWACNLDHLGIKWEYEPRSFTLLSREEYVPDFWLPEIGTWLEVKGYGIDRDWKARQLAEVLLCHCTGRCECRWYGGQVVLLGRDAGRKGRTLTWQDGLDINTYLCPCDSCGAYSWRRLRHSLRCRKCQEQPSCWPSLNASGTYPFHRADRKLYTVAE